MNLRNIHYIALVMRQLKGIIWMVFSMSLISCIKELEGPNTEAPKDPVGYGTLVVYTDWVDFHNHCQSFEVTLDGNLIGQITERVASAYCYDNFTLTIDSVIAGKHVLHAGQCDTVSWDLNPDILADQCNVVKLSK